MIDQTVGPTLKGFFRNLLIDWVSQLMGKHQPISPLIGIYPSVRASPINQHIGYASFLDPTLPYSSKWFIELGVVFKVVI